MPTSAAPSPLLLCLVPASGCCASTTVQGQTVNRTGDLNWASYSRDYSEFPVMLHVRYRHVGEQSSTAKERGLLQLAAPPPQTSRAKSSHKTIASYAPWHYEFNNWIEPATWDVTTEVSLSSLKQPQVAGLCNTTVQIRLLAQSGV